MIKRFKTCALKRNNAARRLLTNVTTECEQSIPGRQSEIHPMTKLTVPHFYQCDCKCYNC